MKTNQGLSMLGRRDLSQNRPLPPKCYYPQNDLKKWKTSEAQIPSPFPRCTGKNSGALESILFEVPLERDPDPAVCEWEAVTLPPPSGMEGRQVHLEAQSLPHSYMKKMFLLR